MHSKGLQRVFIISRSEDDEGLPGKAREQFEAVQSRHLNIEEKRVNRQVREFGERGFGVSLLPDDLDSLSGAEHLLKPFERERFIIHEKDPQRSDSFQKNIILLSR